MPPHAVHAPTARPRSDSGNVRTITASAAGVSSAPDTPCSARAATSISIVGAIAHSSEVTPKPPTPRMKIRRSPSRSPSEPPISSSEPSVTRYALAVHCWPASPPPRSSEIAGSATLTAVLSTVTTVVPRMQATSTSRLVDSADPAERSPQSLSFRRFRPETPRAGAGSDARRRGDPMRQLTSLDAQFLAVESARTYGHVGGLAVYDPATAPGGDAGRAGHLPPRRRAAAPAAAVPLAARRACRSGSTTRTGSRTPTSTSTSTSASRPCRRPATTASSPRPSRGSSPARWTATGRCGSCT